MKGESGVHIEVCKFVWFVTVATAANLIILWFMPKRLTRQEIYVTWMVMAALTMFTDLMLGANTQLYDVLGPGLQKRAVPIEILLPPSFGVIWVNFMPERWSRFIPYLVFVVLFSDAFELLSVWTGYITYKKWNLGYSSVIYLLGLLFLRWHVHFIRRRPT